MNVDQLTNNLVKIQCPEKGSAHSRHSVTVTNVIPHFLSLPSQTTEEPSNIFSQRFIMRDLKHSEKLK